MKLFIEVHKEAFARGKRKRPSKDLGRIKTEAEKGTDLQLALQ